MEVKTMRRSVIAVAYTRPTVVFLVIIFLCTCSMLFSTYYVHTVKVTSPLEFGMVFSRSDKGESGLGTGDDQSGKKVLSSSVNSIPDINSNLPILNNIDISLHIQTSKPKQLESNVFHDLEKLNSNNGGHGKVSKDAADNTNVSVKSYRHKAVRKEEMWPVKSKVYQEEKRKKAIKDGQLVEYEIPHRTRKDWNGEKYIVYLCTSKLVCAGWGDRQHGIFSVYMLSLFTNRTFKVDMRCPCPLNKLYHPRIHNWKVNETEFDGLSSTHIYAINDREFRDSMKVLDFNAQYPQDVVYLTNNYDFYYSLKANPFYKELFKEKLKNRPRPIAFADLWHSVFKMNKRVVRRYTPALNNARPSKDHQLVCAHIRFGRNPSIPFDGDIRNTMSTIKPFWDFVKKHSDPSKYRFFLASDWQDFRHSFNRQFRNITVEVAGDIIHIDKLPQKGRRQSNLTLAADQQEEACVGFEKVIADQYVLSQCDILLLTYSVFGKAAAYMRRSNEDLYLMDKGEIKLLVLFNDKYLHKSHG